MIPGLNLLAIASTAIATDTVQWSRFLSRTRDALGQWVSVYAEPEPIRGSVQPIEAREYQALGLDMAKRYVTLFTSHNVQHVKRESSPDKFEWNGAYWEAQGGDDWYQQDGWREVILVYLGDVPAPVPEPEQ